MKRFKNLALSILGVTVLSLGLYACTNDAETSLQEDNITLTELTQLIDM